MYLTNKLSYLPSARVYFSTGVADVNRVKILLKTLIVIEDIQEELSMMERYMKISIHELLMMTYGKQLMLYIIVINLYQAPKRKSMILYLPVS